MDNAVEAPLRRPQRLVVTNQKGGVGKTATTYNLGMALALRGRRVVLCDSDPAGGLTYAARFDFADIPSGASMVAVWGGERIALQSLSRNLSLVPSAPGAMVALERAWAEGIPDVMGVFDWLEADVVVIDTPPNIGPLSIASLLVADAILIPVIPEYQSLGNLDTLLSTIASVNPSARILGAVPTMANTQRRMTAEFDAELVRRGLRIFGAIPRDVAVAEIPAHGKTVFETRPSSAKVVERFAQLGADVDAELNAAPVGA